MTNLGGMIANAQEQYMLSKTLFPDEPANRKKLDGYLAKAMDNGTLHLPSTEISCAMYAGAHSALSYVKAHHPDKLETPEGRSLQGHVAELQAQTPVSDHERYYGQRR